MQQEIFKELELLGHKFSNIERELEMPQNYLSRFKNPDNKLPEKWFEPLKKYIEKYKLAAAEKETVAIAPEIKESEPSLPPTKLVVDANGIKEKPMDFDQAEKLKIAKETNAKINKDFGAGSIMFLGDEPMASIETIPTGVLSLDRALGIGGLPRGRIVEIYGPESSGKTTLALHVIAEAQKMGLLCTLIDVEHAFDPEYAESLGIKLENLNVSQPDYGEQALEIADRSILTGAYGVLVIDSVAALTPKSEIEGEMGESKIGLQARLMSQACRKMTSTISKTNTLCIFINQLRNKIGVVYGSPEVTTGGMALQFYSSVRLDVRRIAQLKDGDDIFGNRVKIKIVKNKCAPPFKSTEVDIIYGKGIDKLSDLVELAVEAKIIQKSGSWYSYNEGKLGQGKDNVCALLKDNEEMLKEIITKLTS